MIPNHAWKWTSCWFLVALCWTRLRASGIPPIHGLSVPHPQDAESVEDGMDDALKQNRFCFPVTAKADIPGGRDAYINMTYVTQSGAVSVAIYNLEDQVFMGETLSDNSYVYMCNDQAIREKKCTTYGQILFHGEEKDRRAPILSQLVQLRTVPMPYIIHYPVVTSGIYCLIGTSPNLGGDEGPSYARVHYENAHGLLPAMVYPKLPFYGITCLVYLSVFLLWMGKSLMHWKEILPVQKYISGLVALLVLETGMHYFYWMNWNTNGRPSWSLLVISSILNSARNSASLFVLLIVALGYGVVKPSLGDDMRKCQILALIHLIFGALYTGFSLSNPEDGGILVLLVVIPLAITLTMFYVWTLSALASTTQHLESRRQYYKLDMYKQLWRLIFFAGINLVAYFVVNTFWFSQRSSTQFLARWWRWRWFVLDGWLNLLYSVCMLTICVLWRPTSNNSRYGLEELMSDPLAEEFDFELPDYFDGERFGGGGETMKRTGKDHQDQEVVFALDSDGESEGGSVSPRRSRSASPQRRQAGSASSPKLN